MQPQQIYRCVLTYSIEQQFARAVPAKSAEQALDRFKVVVAEQGITEDAIAINVYGPSHGWIPALVESQERRVLLVIQDGGEETMTLHRSHEKAAAAAGIYVQQWSDRCGIARTVFADSEPPGCAVLGPKFTIRELVVDSA